MAINPLQAPINYQTQMVDLAPAFEQFGQALSERKKRTETETVKAQYAADLQAVLDNPSMGEFNKFALKYPQQREVIKDVSSRFTQEQQDSEFNIGRDVAVALENDKPEVALEILGQTIEAREKAKLPVGVYGQVQQILSNTDDPDRLKKAKAQTNFALTLLNPEKFGKVVDSLAKQKLDPEVLREQVAKSNKAVQEAQNVVDTAPDDVAKAAATRKLEEEKVKQETIKTQIADATQAEEQARIIAVAEKARSDADKAVADKQKAVLETADTPERLKAEQELRKAQAAKAAVDAKYADQQQKVELDKKAADLGLTKAQKNKVLVETSNLNLTGKLLKLDFDAALKGVPLPSGKGGTVGTATEDERKAAGWLVQADNAYKNMLNAMYTKEGKQTGAQGVGFFEAIGLGKVSQSPERQKFNQASASLAEALLRAATGAGQNEAEVRQKIEELTPTYFDTQENINQKLDAIPVYLDSLKARAGRAAPAGYVAPTKESVIATKPFSVTVGGKTFNLPTQQALDIFVNSDLYKKAAGNK